MPSPEHETGALMQSDQRSKEGNEDRNPLRYEKRVFGRSNGTPPSESDQVRAILEVRAGTGKPIFPEHIEDARRRVRETMAHEAESRDTEALKRFIQDSKDED